MITIDFIKPYFAKNPPTHDFYAESIKIHHDLCIHADGIYPDELVETARPNEADEYKEYRKQVFTPVTKTWFSKVTKTIAKGHRAEDWGITWKQDVKGVIPKDETLEKYTTVNYPYFDSLENWTFSIALPTMLKDPGGVIATFPLPKKTTSDTEYLRPYTHYFCSENVIDFRENNFAVLMDEEKSLVRVGDKLVYEGIILHFFDTDSYLKAVQTGEKDDYDFEIEVSEQGEIVATEHGIGYLPVTKLGGVVNKFYKGDTLWDSFISDCLNNWNEAIRRYSDHQVNMVLHLHPFEWEMADTPCRVCKGTGKEVTMAKGKKEEYACHVCGGNGHVSIKTPFGKKIIQPTIKKGVNDNTNIPTPPAGIIERDVASISFLKEEYKDQIREGLAAINLEWVMNAPMNVSGESKDKDRAEAQAFFHEVYRHLVLNVMYPHYYFVSKWRYKYLSEEEIEYNLPSIKVPAIFDFDTAETVGVRLKNAIEGKFNPLIVNKLNIEYAKKELGDDSSDVQKMEVMQQLDPLPNKTVDEKMTDLASKSISIESYILSENITSFIERAINEKKDFFKMNYSQKLEVLQPYIKEVINSNKESLVPIQEVS